MKKTANEYKKEYAILKIKLESLKAHVADRLLNLVNRFPQTSITMKDGTIGNAKLINTYNAINLINLDTQILNIQEIETHIENLSPYKQGNLF